MKLSYLDLTTTDPSYNLAMEQYVFDCLPRDRMYFMLWQNDNSIIVGKYQNTLSEINLEAVERRGFYEWALSQMTPMEQRLCEMRFTRRLGQREAAKLLGVSQMQVSRMERRMLERLRGLMNSEDERP